LEENNSISLLHSRVASWQAQKDDYQLICGYLKTSRQRGDDMLAQPASASSHHTKARLLQVQQFLRTLEPLDVTLRACSLFFLAPHQSLSASEFSGNF